MTGNTKISLLATTNTYANSDIFVLVRNRGLASAQTYVISANDLFANVRANVVSVVTANITTGNINSGNVQNLTANTFTFNTANGISLNANNITANVVSSDVHTANASTIQTLAATLLSSAAYVLSANIFVTHANNTLTLNASHSGKIVLLTSVSNTTVTLNTSLTTPFACKVVRLGANVNFANATGLTLQAASNTLTTQYTSFDVIKYSNTEVILV